MSTLLAPQLEEMRDEVGRLRGELARLEARLSEETAYEDVWNVWPYTWAFQAKAFLADYLEKGVTRTLRFVLKRNNTKAMCRAKSENAPVGLRLV